MNHIHRSRTALKGPAATLPISFIRADSIPPSGRGGEASLGDQILACLETMSITLLMPWNIDIHT